MAQTTLCVCEGATDISKSAYDCHSFCTPTSSSHSPIFIIAGLLKSQHIDFISIADLTSTSSAEIEPEVDILLSEVDIEVDVFELYGEDVDSEEPTELTLTPPRTHGSAEDHPAPQTKIMALPNRALHGIWDSYAVRFPEITVFLV